MSTWIVFTTPAQDTAAILVQNDMQILSIAKTIAEHALVIWLDLDLSSGGIPKPQVALWTWRRKKTVNRKARR